MIQKSPFDLEPTRPFHGTVVSSRKTLELQSSWQVNLHSFCILFFGGRCREVPIFKMRLLWDPYWQMSSRRNLEWSGKTYICECVCSSHARRTERIHKAWGYWAFLRHHHSQLLGWCQRCGGGGEDCLRPRFPELYFELQRSSVLHCWA